MRKIGVIGSGEIALIHAEALRRQGEGFSAAYDLHQETLESFCRETGAAAYESAGQLLSSSDAP